MLLSGRTSLKNKHTFGMDVWCNQYLVCSTEDELRHGLTNLNNPMPLLVLGEGSNILFTKDFEGTVIQLANVQIKVLSETNQEITIACEAGRNWDDFVQYTVEQDWSGLENLSGIPGTVGACPIQNIGAYGAEVKDTILRVEGIYRDSLEKFEFDYHQCQFGYRHSIFKDSLKDKTIITRVVFRLRKQAAPDIAYKDLQAALANLPAPGSKEVRQAVLEIRKNKLPDPKEAGNSGSFFKNPIVSRQHWEALQKTYTATIPMYPAGSESVKIPAAYLIEQCGWKGYRRGDAGVHPRQPLVLVNYGKARGYEILDLANKIIESVRTKYQLELTPEVNII